MRPRELATRERPVVWVDERTAPATGPARKFDDLFLALYPRLHDLCHRVVGDGFEAEDVVQEAFLRLAGAPVLDRPEEEVAAWLRRVCLNLSYNRLRWERRARARLERAGRLEAGDGADPDDGPLGSVLRAEEQAAVRRALWALPERQRSCLLLRHSGYSYAEIAETCQLAVGSVGVLLARAERAFRDAYQPQADEGAVT